ncbi:MAG: hypothetical protein AAF997_01235 [Myxococcota bacterium]
MTLSYALRAAAIASLSGVAVAGCGGTEVTDEPTGGDAGNPGNTGAGGNAGAPGAAGGVGGGGAGGTAGYPYDDYDDCGSTFPKLSCETTCGVDNHLPRGPVATEQSLECSVMGIPLEFGVALSVAEPTMDSPEGNRLVAEFVMPAVVVDLFLLLGCSFDIVEVELGVGTESGETLVTTNLTPVPCLVCFFSGTPVTIRLDPVPIAIGVDAPLTLTTLTLVLNISGLELVFSTEPPMDNCVILPEGATPPPLDALF